ncbi:MAG: hypothetical protein U1E87_00665 [Alphaproteobacteria bacterium]
MRAELARKIARLVPGLTGAAADALCESAFKVLERLAADNLPRVRTIVAEEIKFARNVPKALALKLANDVEIAVAAPILQYSPCWGSRTSSRWSRRARSTASSRRSPSATI